MKLRTSLLALALALGTAACSSGSDIQSPGGTNTGGGTGGSTGGGGTGGGSTTVDCPTISGLTITQASAQVGGLTDCAISGTITSDVTLTAGSGFAYRLDGRVDVGVDDGPSGGSGDPAILRIEEGVTIFGSSGADYLVVNRGSQIFAEGTASAPIVFTSEADLERQNDSDTTNDFGGNSTAEWGGLVILGQAGISECDPASTDTQSANCQNFVEGVQPDAFYGGPDQTDDSGVLSYVQVRFAGFPLPGTSGNELNGITFGGVGSGTQVDHIQVHNNDDDGVEFFGGTVDVDFLVLTGNDDDSIDTDLGYSGTITRALVIQRTDGGDNGIESSSAGESPYSSFTLRNFTVLENGLSNGHRLNSNTAHTLENGIIVTNSECFRWESSAGAVTLSSMFLDCASGLARADSDGAAAVAAFNADPNNVSDDNTLENLIFPGTAEQAVTATGGENFIGAFESGVDTLTNNWASGWTFGLFDGLYDELTTTTNACPSGTTTAGTKNGQQVCEITGTITSNLTLPAGPLYELVGRVDVGIDLGPDPANPDANGDAAILSIEPGVTLFGNSGADYMVVNRGSQIFVNGTANQPVVFTSEDDLDGVQADPLNATAEWGGLVLLGRAGVSECDPASTDTQSVNCQNFVEGVQPDAFYGGATQDDSSGSLSYVQLKYAGFPLPGTSGNELNGITFGGVGFGTNVDHIQVHNNDDDGIEFFGGTVNGKYIVLTGNDDDSVDTDLGYSGNLQYVIAVQRADGGDNGNEASSAGEAPFSSFNMANFTLVTNDFAGNGLRLNSNTAQNLINGVIVSGAECIRWQSSAGDVQLNSILFSCAGDVLATAADDAAAAQAAFNANANNTLAQATLASPGGSLPGFINDSVANGVTAQDPAAVDTFFDTTDYVGAVENAADTWWQGWTCGLDADDC